MHLSCAETIYMGLEDVLLVLATTYHIDNGNQKLSWMNLETTLLHLKQSDNIPGRWW